MVLATLCYINHTMRTVSVNYGFSELELLASEILQHLHFKDQYHLRVAQEIGL